MEVPSVRRLTSARIPTADGEFTLILYENSKDDKDHLALVYGSVEGQTDVLVRIHSECFTGDVLGSLRCDCGEQLNTSMRRVAEAGDGVILYLRQEGRGIGLLSKLKAYNLQDEGYDTVEANRMLGHQADERDYHIAAGILQDLGVTSVRLLTNNPEKIESLEENGIEISERVALQPEVTRHNAEYLRTKVNRMRHLFDLGPLNGGTDTKGCDTSVSSLKRRAEEYHEAHNRPFVTLTYAQSLDGSIASGSGQPLSISSEKALGLTHRLRAAHEAILVGIGTVLTDDPRLTVRRSSGMDPRPVVLDSELKMPVDARLFERGGPKPIVFAGREADPERESAIEDKGATVVRCPAGSGGLSLPFVLDWLGEREIVSLMVEGGSQVLTSFLRERHVQHVVLTVAPMFVGGKRALDSDVAGPATESASDMPGAPRLTNVERRRYGDDVVIEGDPVWPREAD